MKNNWLSILVSLFLVVGGATLVIVADRQGWLLGSSSETAHGCPHGLSGGNCPFCDESIIEKMGQCVGHGVPEAFCTRCNTYLITAFKTIGDWCAAHNIPESQCTICNPGILDGQNSGEKTDSLSAPIQIIRTSDLPRNMRTPSVTCKTNTLRVQFISPDIARKAGLEYMRIESREITQTLTCNAEVAYDGSRYARLSSRVPGVVREVKKDLGQHLVAGDVLAVVDSTDFGMAKAEYLRLQSEVDAAGMLVERSQQWFQRINQMEVRLTAGQYLEALKLLEVARQNFNREKGLMEKLATSERDLLEVRSEIVKAQNTVDSLRQKLLLFGVQNSVIDKLNETNIASLEERGTTSEQPVLDARRVLDSSQIQQQSAINRLQVLGLTDEQIEQAGRRGNVSSLLPLRAPFRGIVVERFAVMGEVVDTTKSLFAIADTSRMWTILDIYESDIPDIRIGQPVVLEVEGLRGEQYGGYVTWISSHVDSRTRTLKVRAEIANHDGFLRAGMFGKAIISVRDREQALIVPKTAIQWEGCCNIVFVKRSDILFEPRKVRLGYETDGFVVVEDGAKEGEEIVTTGSFLLKTEILKGSIGAGCCEIKPGKKG